MFRLTVRMKSDLREMGKLHPNVRLVTLQSHYRSVLLPLSKFIDTVEHKARENNYRVTVLIPQFITKRVGITSYIINLVY